MLTLAAFAAAFIASPAQDLSTEVIVDRTVETALPEASPLKNVMPSMLPAPAPSLSLKSADYSLLSDFDPIAGLAKPLRYTGIPAPDAYKGYVWLGYFPVYNLGLAAGYRFVDTEATKAGADINFDGFSYGNKPTGTDVSSNYLRVQAYGSHRLANNVLLSLAGSYGHDFLTTPGTAPGYDSQSTGRADIRARASRYGTDSYWEVALRYRYLGLGKDVRPGLKVPAENHLQAAARVMRPLSGELKGAVDFTADVLGGRSTSGMLALTPKVMARYGDLSFSAGLRFDLGISVPGNKFHVAPDISALWQFTEKAAIYARIGGGSRLNTLGNLFDYSPFAPVGYATMPSYSPVDAKAGVRMGNFGGLRAEIFTGYTIVNNTPMPVANLAGSYSSLAFVPTDIRGWNAGIEVGYRFSDMVDADARFVVGPEGINSADGRYFDRARTCLDVKVDYMPAKAWTVSATYRLRTGRRHYACCAADGNKVETERNMGTVSDLGLRGTWAVGERLSVFLSLDNLFNRRPELLPGLSAQGLHGLLGADFRF